jgi:hypothetical protein
VQELHQPGVLGLHADSEGQVFVVGMASPGAINRPAGF